MNQNRKSIIDMAQGDIKERADYEMARILDNIMDPNTTPTKKRTLTLQLVFSPDWHKKPPPPVRQLRERQRKIQLY